LRPRSIASRKESQSGPETGPDAGTLPVNPFCVTEGGIVTVTDCPADPSVWAATIGTNRTLIESNVSNSLLKYLEGMAGISETVQLVTLTIWLTIAMNLDSSKWSFDAKDSGCFTQFFLFCAWRGQV
jgi:hypothetical protein